MREISQEAFDGYCAISDRINDLKDKVKGNNTLTEKLELRRQIKELDDERRKLIEA